MGYEAYKMSKGGTGSWENEVELLFFFFFSAAMEEREREIERCVWDF